MARKQHKIKQENNNMTTVKLPAIQQSSNYSEFIFKVGNRPIDTSLKKYKDLRNSMKKHGWIPSFPATVNTINGKRMIIDGQNRYTAAKELGLKIVFVSVQTEYKISEIAEAFRPWNSNDFSASHAAEGNAEFRELERFRARHNISSVKAAGLLMAKRKMIGDSSGSASAVVKSGDFSFTREDSQYADSVLHVCDHMPQSLRRNRGATAAIARILMVDDVCASTLANKILANQKDIKPKSSVDEYVQMFETVYNKRNQSPVAIALKVLELSRAK
jgi:hypothetical protein